MAKIYTRGGATDGEQPAGPSLRLELLIRVMDRVGWGSSESVVCKPGSSRNMLRLIKRYHRVCGILTRAAKEPPSAQLASSPYSSTLGVRLLLGELVLEEMKPEITSTEPNELDQQMRPGGAKLANRFGRKPFSPKQIGLLDKTEQPAKRRSAR